MPCNYFHRDPMIPAKTKARKWTRMSSLGTGWKLNPVFWSSWLTWRREQPNEGWELGGKGAQKYGRREAGGGRRENVVREAGDSDPVSPQFPATIKINGTNPAWCIVWRVCANFSLVIGPILQVLESETKISQCHELESKAIKIDGRI